LDVLVVFFNIAAHVVKEIGQSGVKVSIQRGSEFSELRIGERTKRFAFANIVDKELQVC
jgi:hypothetical protein